VLYQRSLFTGLIGHSTFHDIVSNIDMVSCSSSTTTTDNTTTTATTTTIPMLSQRSLFTVLIGHSTFDDIVGILSVAVMVAVTLWSVAWHSGNALCRINEVTLRRAQLVLGWVTVCGQVNHLGMKPASYVDSASYLPWDGIMSITIWAE